MSADNNKSKFANDAHSAPGLTGQGLVGQVAHGFIDSKLTPLVIVAALLLGAFAILQTPREEEPQIVVPMLDVFVQMPGASSQEVAQRVSLPMEKLLREVPGVEYELRTAPVRFVPMTRHIGIAGWPNHDRSWRRAFRKSFRSRSGFGE